ncbi:MAG: acetate--CoA ligase family protein [Hyphomicrobiaceae bacterium]
MVEDDCMMKEGLHVARYGSPLWQALFEPKRIALIGLSSDPNRPAGRPLKFLLRDGYPGTIYPINPHRSAVQGVPSFSSLDALPQRPDHAYILLDTEHAMDAAKACFRAGVPVVQVLADGFAESGDAGTALQEELASAARCAGSRLLGPNCMGLADLNLGLSLTVNATFEEGIVRGGRIALVSQSGSMMGGLMTRAAHIGLKFSKIVAVGNEADLSVGEIGQMLVGDPQTDVILLFLETIRKPEEVVQFANMGYRAGKPIIAYKLGKSSVGQELAVLHTGALLSDDNIASAFMQDVGIARVTMLESLFEAVPLFTGRRPPTFKPQKVGVITTTGGGGASVCDELSSAGVDLLTPSQDTVDAIASTGVRVGRGPLTDVTLAGARPDVIGPSLVAMADDPECNILVCVLGSSSRSDPETAMQPILSADVQGKPLAAYLVPDAPLGMRILVEEGISVFRTPETCADVVRAFTNWRPPRMERISAPRNNVTTLRTLDEHASLEFLTNFGVPITDRAIIEIAEIEHVNLPFAYPVVAKILADGIAHKTEAGAVITNIAHHAELVAAAKQISDNVSNAHPDVLVDRLLVAPMIEGIQEVLIGYRCDAQVGPVVTVAAGGVMVGLYDDKSVKLAPVGTEQAMEMIEEVTGLAPVRGYRGQEGGNLIALADVIVALSRLGDLSEPFVLEAEINPLIVNVEGAIAVDALVRIGAV